MVIWFDCGRRVLKMMWVLKNNAMNGVLTQSCRPNSWNSNIHKFIIHSALDEVFTLKHIVLLFKRNNHSFTIAYAHVWVCRLFGFRCDKSWTSAAMKLSYKLPDHVGSENRKQKSVRECALARGSHRRFDNCTCTALILATRSWRNWW